MGSGCGADLAGVGGSFLVGLRWGFGVATAITSCGRMGKVAGWVMEGLGQSLHLGFGLSRYGNCCYLADEGVLDNCNWRRWDTMEVLELSALFENRPSSVEIDHQCDALSNPSLNQLESV